MLSERWEYTGSARRTWNIRRVRRRIKALVQMIPADREAISDSHAGYIYIFLPKEQPGDCFVSHRHASATQIPLCMAVAALRLLDAHDILTSCGAALACSTIHTWFDGAKKCLALAKSFSRCDPMTSSDERIERRIWQQSTGLFC